MEQKPCKKQSHEICGVAGSSLGRESASLANPDEHRNDKMRYQKRPAVPSILAKPG